MWSRSIRRGKSDEKILLASCSLMFGIAVLSLGGATNSQNMATVHAVTTPASNGLTAPEKVDGTNTEVKSVTGNSTSGKVVYTNGLSTATTATYKQNKYQNSSQATTSFANYQNVTETNGPKITLSDGTKAVRQGVMGHVYIQWQKNGWNVTAVADTDQLTTTSVSSTNKAATAVANKVQKTLKATQVTTQDVTKGNVVVYSSSQQKPVNSISWQQGKKVARVTGANVTTTAKIAKDTLK